MHNTSTTNRMIASFLARKAEQFPEVFEDGAPAPSSWAQTASPLIDSIVR